ncbi:MAG TPA: SGNH/GDSL hydrolase family protein [Patescibacteria group bacterium]|nr:SGNH/GDSL hydrolase family protein [Patescibacteria group bacterium]
MLGMVLRSMFASMMLTASIFNLSASAADQSLWRSGQNFTTETSTIVRPNPNCVEIESQVVDLKGNTTTEKVCTQRGSSLTLGQYVDSTNHKYYVVKIGFDQKFRRLANIDGYSTSIYLRPSDDALIIQFPGAQKVTQPSLSIFRLSDGGISPMLSDGNGVLQYQLDFTKRTTLMRLESPDGSAYYTAHNGYILSDNREYLLMWQKDNSVVVVNTVSGSMRVIAAEHISGVVDAAISDDGRYAVLGTLGYLYDTNGCGEAYDYAAHDRLVHNIRLTSSCSMTNIYNTIYHIRNIQPMGANFYFTDDNTALAFDYPRYNPIKHVLIKTEAYNPTRLDYLALGDSYSSGEGDIGTKDGSSYYTPVTDDSGGCHLSTRSYPFLLRDAWGIDPSRMQSVACSGAQVLPDYMHDLASYQGQNARLGSLSAERRSELQSRALDAFIPGYAPQLEFVKKYQPKTITLTGGGNDVGFADILSYCASPEMTISPPITYQFIPIPFTCDYAVKGSSLNKMLYSSIDTVSTYLSLFLKEVVDVSPNTHIILVGYPSFIAADTNCGLGSGYLNRTEKEMINDAVTYMNKKLKALASRENAYFVDIEDSLAGGRLCEGSRYVTSLGDLGLKKVIRDQEVSEAFHPNSRGHSRITDIITSTNISANSAERVTADTNLTGSYAARLSFMKSQIVLRSAENVKIDTSPRVFADGTRATLTAFSKPTSLGEFSIESDGALHTTADFSSLTPGRHVITLSGYSTSGEPLMLYQFITIRATEIDSDGDGLLDDTDRCNFIDKWIEEKTGSNICVYSANSTSSEPSRVSQQPSLRLNTGIGGLKSDETSSLQLNSTDFSRLAETGAVVARDSSSSVLGQTTERNHSPPIATRNAYMSDSRLWAIIVIGILSGGVIAYAANQKSR